MKRQERENYLAEFKNPIERELKAANIEAEITGRPKNFYSISQQDAVRATSLSRKSSTCWPCALSSKTARECYHTPRLGTQLLPPLTPPLQGFYRQPQKQYVPIPAHHGLRPPGFARWKSKSAPGKCTTPPKIGIAAHWRYKEGDNAPKALEERMDWLRQVLDWQRDATDPEEFMENLKIELFQDEIFIFTPHGDLIQLPKGGHPRRFRLCHPHRYRPCTACPPRSTAISSPSTPNCKTATTSTSSPRRTKSRGSPG